MLETQDKPLSAPQGYCIFPGSRCALPGMPSGPISAHPNPLVFESPVQMPHLFFSSEYFFLKPLLLTVLLSKLLSHQCFQCQLIEACIFLLRRPEPDFWAEFCMLRRSTRALSESAEQRAKGGNLWETLFLQNSETMMQASNMRGKCRVWYQTSRRWSHNSVTV